MGTYKNKYCFLILFPIMFSITFACQSSDEEKKEKCNKNIVISKEYHNSLKKELYDKIEEINSDTLNLLDRILLATDLYTDSRYNVSPDLEKIKNKVPKYFIGYMSRWNITGINDVIESDSNSVIPSIFKFTIVEGLARRYTRNAKLDSAIYYFELIDSINLGYSSDCINVTYPCVKKAKMKLDSIKLLNLSRDEFLYKEALVLEKLVQCGCWFGDSWYNYSIVAVRYDEILKEYPNSEYIEDAEYWMIKMKNYGQETGEFGKNQIPEIRNFIQDYPNSKYIPNILMRLASSYIDWGGPSVEEKSDNYKLAIKELEELLRKYELDSVNKYRVEYGLKLYKEELNKLMDTTILQSE